jgi:hypothetical protein
LVLFFSLWFANSQPFVETAGGFFIGAASVFPGTLLAPRWKAQVGLVLSGATVGTLMLIGESQTAILASALGGGLFSVSVIVRICAGLLPPRLRYAGELAACLLLIGFTGMSLARYRDVPPRPDAIPTELSHALGTNAHQLAATYEYDLGGFIDHQWLWRIDATTEGIATVVASLKLRGTNAVPARFWRMPPSYWPRTMPPAGDAYQSEGFTAEERGQDGSHYFLIHDKVQSRAFVWVKLNF